MNPKKSLLAVALAMTMNQGIAQAAPVVNYNFLGTFTMYTPSGSTIGGVRVDDSYVTGSMTMDLGTGTGSATLQPSTTFTGFWWTMHSIALTSTGPGTLHADMLIDWGFTGSQLYQSTTEFGITPTAPCSGMGCYTVGNTFTLTTLDGYGPCYYTPGYIFTGPDCPDGVLGNPMNTGPFIGYNNTFSGTLTVTSVVPIPPAVWLFGSGLVGLLGLSRRRKDTVAPGTSSS